MCSSTFCTNQACCSSKPTWRLCHLKHFSHLSSPLDSQLEGFSNFNIYSHSVQPYKYDRKQSNLPISIHFSIFNIRYIYLTHTSSMRRNETHKQLNIFETKQKWKNNSKTTKIDTIESVYQS